MGDGIDELLFSFSPQTKNQEFFPNLSAQNFSAFLNLGVAKAPAPLNAPTLRATLFALS
jgi:hypothetical protein